MLLKLSADCVEVLPFSDSAVANGKLLCHLTGKKSILRSVMTGSMSLNQVLNKKQFLFGFF